MNQRANAIAPDESCDCVLCRTMRRRLNRSLGYRLSNGSLAEENDLAANYQRYLDGTLVPELALLASVSARD